MKVGAESTDCCFSATVPLMIRWFLLVFAVLFSGTATADTPDLPRVYVGVYLHDVSSFDQPNGVFDVDVELWAKWRC